MVGRIGQVLQRVLVTTLQSMTPGVSNHGGARVADLLAEARAGACVGRVRERAQLVELCEQLAATSAEAARGSEPVGVAGGAQ